jgi:hypothetical protein
MANSSNPIVFFDIAMGGHPVGRIKMELFKNIAPKTVENFSKNKIILDNFVQVNLEKEESL